MFLPFRSYTPLWQAHQMSCRSSRYCTVHCRWVQTAEKARNSPDDVFTRIPGRLLKRKIRPEFAFSSASFQGRVTLNVVGSASFGGIRYFVIGYRMDMKSTPRELPKSQFTARRPRSTCSSCCGTAIPSFRRKREKPACQAGSPASFAGNILTHQQAAGYRWTCSELIAKRKCSDMGVVILEEPSA